MDIFAYDTINRFCAAVCKKLKIAFEIFLFSGFLFMNFWQHQALEIPLYINKMLWLLFLFFQALLLIIINIPKNRVSYLSHQLDLLSVITIMLKRCERQRCIHIWNVSPSKIHMYVCIPYSGCVHVCMYVRTLSNLPNELHELAAQLCRLLFPHICTMSCVQASATTRQFDSACACAPPSSGAQAANTWRYIFSMRWRLHTKCVCISLFIRFFLCIFLCFAFFHSVQFEVVNMC